MQPVKYPEPAMQNLENLIDQGTGRMPADIVLRGGRFYDLVTGELVASDIAICGDRIVGTCGDYQGREVIDIIDVISVFRNVVYHSVSHQLAVFDFKIMV